MEKAIESLILEALGKEVSLKTINNYGENLLHLCAANGCSQIVKEILEKKICNLNRKNVFGWTPLMQAVRNGKIDCVKILLANGANVTESTYLGMSVIGLATAAGKEMFETVYKFCPSALEMTTLDEVCPLSIAAMKNDKDLFLKLLELGLDPSKANTFAHLMMKASLIPEISLLANPVQETESYWNNCTDNIEIFDKENDEYPKMPTKRKKVDSAKILIHDADSENSRHLESKNKMEELNLLVPVEEKDTEYKSLISPTFTYNYDGAFPPSPKPVFSRDEKNIVENNEMKEEFFFMEVHDLNSNSYYVCDRPLRRCQKFRPPDLEFLNDSADLNATLSFVPEYSPMKSPNVPPEIEDENAVFGDSTPTPPHGTAPPRAFILTPKDAPIAFLLHKYGLGRHILTFLEQEVDVELFLTLSDEDLEEIGIKSNTERLTLLSVIDECKKRGVCY